MTEEMDELCLFALSLSNTLASKEHPRPRTLQKVQLRMHKDFSSPLHFLPNAM